MKDAAAGLLERRRTSGRADCIKIDSGIAAGLTGWVNGDFNYNGKINIDDYTIIDNNLPIQGPPLGSASGGSMTQALGAVVPPSLGWGSLATTWQDIADDLLN